jgi:crotonobetaine/carnitine-CoA ligase
LDDRTILGSLALAAELSPEKDVVRFVGGERRSAEALLQEAAVMAGLLGEAGVLPGDRVAIMTSNRVEFLWAFFGAAHAGAISVPLNTSLRGPILEHMLRDSSPAAVVVETTFFEAVLPALRNVGSTARIFVVSGTPSTVSLEGFDVFDLPEALEGAAIPPVVVDRYADASILYTSGTTGPSKGVLHSHNSLIAFSEGADWMFEYKKDDVLHNCLPLFHANALCVTLIPALRKGSTAVFGQRFSASGFWAELRNEGATTTSILGSMVPILWAAPARDDDTGHSVHAALCVPTPPADIYDAFGQRFGIRLVSQYGMTDTSSIIGTPPGVPGRAGYAGVLHPNYECIVVDEHDQQVPDGVAGEGLVRPRKPDIMMRAYWNNPTATLDAFRNLWFHTGDILIRDSDGWFRFMDRSKDAMRRFGENISSFEVETVLCMHPSVEEVAVYAVPSDLSEDEVMAAIVFRADMEGDLEAIGRHCDENLPYFASPRFLVRVDQLPKTENLKVRKDVLRKTGITIETLDRGPRGRKGARARTSSTTN